GGSRTHVALNGRCWGGLRPNYRLVAGLAGPCQGSPNGLCRPQALAAAPQPLPRRADSLPRRGREADGAWPTVADAGGRDDRGRADAAAGGVDGAAVPARGRGRSVVA